MVKRAYDVVVVGSGPGGLAAAIAAKRNGADDVLIVERDVEMGGILLQCIHHGFGTEILGDTKKRRRELQEQRKRFRRNRERFRKRRAPDKRSFRSGESTTIPRRGRFMVTLIRSKA